MTLRLAPGLLTLAVLIAASLLILPAPVGITPLTMRAAAICVLAIGMWGTNVVPSYFGAMIVLFAGVVLAVAPESVVFSGFTSGATWMVFGGLVMGLGVQRTGLDKRLVRGMLGLFPRSYLALCYGLSFGGAAMIVLVPAASGRVALIVPIIAAFAGKLGFDADSRGRTGLILAAVVGTLTPGFSVLPANVPNMSLYGAVESIYHVKLAFAEYLLLNFPVLATASLLIYPLMIWTLFRQTPTDDAAAEPHSPLGRDEIKLLAIVTIAFLFLVTDRWHGISPAWVVLGTALVIVAPRIGVLPVQALARDLDYGPVLFVAGVIGLGAVATTTGIGALLAEKLLHVVPLARGHDGQNFTVITAVAAIVGIFTTLPAQPSIMAPLAQSMADATGWPLMGVLFAPVATWTMFPFYYQAPPMVLAVALGHLRIGRVLAMLCSYMVLSVIFVLPLHFLWGRALGYFTSN